MDSAGKYPCVDNIEYLKYFSKNNEKKNTLLADSTQWSRSQAINLSSPNSLSISCAQLCPFLYATLFCLLDGPWPNTKVHGNGNAGSQVTGPLGPCESGSLRSWSTHPSTLRAAAYTPASRPEARQCPANPW